MAHRLALLRGLLRLAGGTCLIGLVLLALDRTILGPLQPPEWTVATSFAELSENGGPRVVPAYLPESLSWPPARLLRRIGGRPGWWWGLQDGKTGELLVWLGAGTEPFPEPLQPLQPCMTPDPAAPGACPQGWKFFRMDLRTGQVVMLSRLSPEENTRLLKGLELPSKP